MTRIKLAVFAGTALLAAPAFADDTTEPAAGDPNATAPAGGGETGMAATDTATGAPSWWPKSIIDRPLTVLKGKLGAEADILIQHLSITVAGMTSSDTSEGLMLGAGYGISDKLEVGGSYAFALNEFEIKGPLTLYGNYNLVNDGKLAVSGGVGLAFDFNGIDAMGDSTTEVAIEAGLGVRYKVAPKFAVFTGNPWAPGLVGNHLTLGLTDGTAKTFAIPVGFAMQATPELFAYVDTTLATILLSDPGMGDRASFISDVTPFTLGAWYNVNPNIDAGATLNFYDLQNAGDLWAITFGARYYN